MMRVLLATVLVVVGTASGQEKGQEKGKNPKDAAAAKEFLARALDIKLRLQQAVKEKNVTVMNDLLQERAALAKVIVGVRIDAEMVYLGQRIERTRVAGRRTDVPVMQYAIQLKHQDNAGTSILVDVRMLPNNEQYVFGQIARTAKPKDRFAVAGKVVRVEPGANFTLYIATDHFGRAGE